MTRIKLNGLAVLLPVAVFLAGAQPKAAKDDASTLDPAYRHASGQAYENWRDLKYGLRIHWGVYSRLGVEASWPFKTMSNAQRAEYNQSYRTFNPTDFDAEKWMQLFERCGFKCFAFTTKHHDGFSLFDTHTRVRQRIDWTAPGGPRVEDCDVAYSVMETPFKRDIVKELCEAAHRHQIGIDLYFSHIDWYDADFRMDPIHPFYDRQFTSRSHAPEAYDRMARRHREQIREILSNYGRIDMVCLDIELPGFCWPQIKETVLMARQLQPEVLMRERGIGAYGDYTTPENWVPASAGMTDKRVDRPWMVIHTLSGQFAYDPKAAAYKSGAWILTNLIDICAKGGNFMPSIGPDEKGNFHPQAIAHLLYVGDWLKVNGEAIYKTRPWARYKEGDHIRFTRAQDGRWVYAIALQWPGNQLALASLQVPEGARITLLGSASLLRWTQNRDTGLMIEIPQALQAVENRPCQQAWVFRMEGAQLR